MIIIAKNKINFFINACFYVASNKYFLFLHYAYIVFPFG